MNTNLVSRFAPSPTGRLHLGHAYSAMRAHDLARATGGQFRLRIEDIDEARCTPENVDGIGEDLEWLGLNWDGPIMLQSSRTAAYQDALARLQAMELVYRCWCTRKEIAAAASAPQGLQLLYPGTCRHRAAPPSAPEGAAAREQPYCWRLDCAKAHALVGPLTWTDAKAGEVVADATGLGDVVLARKDAGTSYHIAVVVDDAFQGVTDVVRGQDLFDSTHIHRMLQALLELPVPRYHHHPLVVGQDGERLAKRRNSETIAALRAGGEDPQALMSGLRNGHFPKGYGLAEQR